ncbi:MAG TPA: hypothetical protein VHH34_08285 [Pseudonocardiaceae bacterium]|nr:hypothetical protein [Pseudonocardiaceae bacterium]
MSANTKKYVTWIIIAFVLFFVLGQPEQAAGIVRSGIDGLESAAQSAITFMQSLFQTRS